MPNDTKQEFDVVQTTAAIYRALLESFSRPGQVSDIRDVLAKQRMVSRQEGAALWIAATLLDTEVSHYAELEQDLGRTIRHVTHSPYAPPENADYLIIGAGHPASRVVECIRLAKPGTLEHPEENATLLIQVEDVVERPAAEAALLVSGPGIQGTRGCGVEGISSAWVRERERRNEEYPLGLDIVFYTESGKIMALPRTTAVKEGRARWDTYP